MGYQSQGFKDLIAYKKAFEQACIHFTQSCKYISLAVHKRHVELNEEVGKLLM